LDIVEVAVNHFQTFGKNGKLPEFLEYLKTAEVWQFQVDEQTAGMGTPLLGSSAPFFR